MHRRIPGGRKTKTESKTARHVWASVVFDGVGGAELTLDAPEKAVTPGQSAVIYSGDTVLCGGFID